MMKEADVDGGGKLNCALTPTLFASRYHPRISALLAFTAVPGCAPDVGQRHLRTWAQTRSS